MLDDDDDDDNSVAAAVGDTAGAIRGPVQLLNQGRWGRLAGGAPLGDWPEWLHRCADGAPGNLREDKVGALARGREIAGEVYRQVVGTRIRLKVCQTLCTRHLGHADSCFVLRASGSFLPVLAIIARFGYPPYPP